MLIRKVSYLALTVSAVLLPALPAPAQVNGAAAEVARPPVMRRAGELAGFIRSGDQAALTAYVPGAFVGPMAAEPQRAVQLFSQIHAMLRGAKNVRVTPGEANEAQVTLQSPLTDQMFGFTVTVEPQAPHRITNVRPRPVAPAVDVPLPAGEAERMASLDAYARRLADADYFSGVLVVAKNDRPILERAYGHADRKAATLNTLRTRFNLGSMNKVFTALAIAQLVEAGRLGWEDQLTRYLPDFPDAESAKSIQLRHLLSHTSGLGNYFNHRFFSRPMSSYTDLASYEEVTRGEKLQFAPGTRWFYSNTGMLAAGLVLEKITGRDYYDYIRQAIYRPAGMARSDSYVWGTGVSDLATPYEAEQRDGGFVATEAATKLAIRGSSAGGGWATAGDLLNFSNALRAGKLVRPETWALMSTAKPEIGAERYGYGVALERFADPKRDIVGHGGDAPGTCAVWGEVRDAEAPYTVIILSNSSMGSCHPLAERAYRMIPAKQKRS